jgi:hypothetical protein
VDKQKGIAAELEEIVKQWIGAGDFRVTIHRNPSGLKSIAARSWPTR